MLIPWKSVRRRWAEDGWRAPAIAAEAWLMLGFARAALLCVPFARIVHWSRLVTLTEAFASDVDMPAPQARRVRWAIAAAACRTPWQSLCLAQALAGAWMLRRRGVAHTLVLGAMPSTGTVPMKAHAWLIQGRRILTGEPGHQQYRVLARLAWSPIDRADSPPRRESP